MCSLFHKYRDRGWEFYEADKFEEAITEWRVAADLDPEDGYVLNIIGSALLKLGREEAAIVEWRKSVQLEPDYDAPHTNLAYALSDPGYSPEALAAVRAAIRLKSDNVYLYNYLGFHLLVQADENKDKAGWEAATAAFQQAIDIDPTNSYARLYLAKAQWARGQKQEATSTLKAAIAISPSDIELYLILQEYQAATRQFRDMGQTIDAMNELPDPEEKIAYYYSDLLNRLWLKLRPILLLGVVLAAVLVGVLIWNRRGRGA